MKNYTTKTLQIFWQHAKKYPLPVFSICVGILAHTILQNAQPVLYKKLIDVLVLSDFKNNLNPAAHIIWIILVVSIIRLAVARSFNFINNYFQPRVMADLNSTCFAYLHRHSFSFFNDTFVGSLVTKVKRYERAFELIADQLTFDLGRTFLDILVILAVLFFYNKTLGFALLIWVVLYLIFTYFFSRFKLPYDMKRALADTKVTAQLADSITNNFNIKIFAGHKKEETDFNNTVLSQFKIRKKSWDLGTTSEVVQSVSMVFLEFVLLTLAVKFWKNGIITLGTIALIQGYLNRLFDKLWSVGKHIRAIYENLADANEMTEILLSPHEISDLKNAENLKVSLGKIEFDNVNFSYLKNASVLENFNLQIAPTQRIALIGPSGGGKSTIVKLLLRFHDIQSGKILIDGQNIAMVTQDSLRENISLVPQDPILFHRSLMENIRYGKPSATDEEVIKAAKSAFAHEFISKAKDGYQTFVGERGIKLSGGERQRVAIARAILKNAPILVLDEATSSLDSESEMYIQKALKDLMQNKTVIVIAHRLSTIMQMDRIIVLDNGKIVEEGKHQELLKMQEGTYQKLWQIQAGGFTS